MAFAHESFYNESSSSVLRINVMVVDDDPCFLQIMSRMLEKSKDTDLSLMEITVVAARDSMEALSTLKVHRNNIDLIITDYYMPGMNGIQLKNRITEEFGNLPVIVMSSDTNKEEESLTCGAMCFIPKPIRANDLTRICEYALTYKRNGKSIVSTEQNHKDADVSAPQQIELLPDLTNAMVTTKKNKRYPSAGPDSRSVNTNGSCVSTDGSRKDRKGEPNGGCGDDAEPRPPKKSKVTWTDDLHDLFLQAIQHIGLDKAVPKKILEFMNIPSLTRENVASHLQKYRIFLRKVARQGLLHSNLLPITSTREPYYNYITPSTSWYETSLNNRSFYTKPGHGLGQSRLLANTREPVRFNQTSPYSYMNRSSVYEPHRAGSSLTQPIRSNLSITNQPFQNEGRRSSFEPSVMANKTTQTSQLIEFGQHEPSAINGNSFNNDMMNSYGSLTPTQPGRNIYGSSTTTQPGLNSYGSVTPTQPGLSSYGSSTPTQPRLSSYGSSTSTQPRLSSYGSSTPTQPGLSSYGTSSLPPTQRVSSFESLISNQSGVSSYGGLTPNQAGLSNYGSLTPYQSGVGSYGSLTPNQPLVGSFGSLTPNQSKVSSFGSLTPNQPRLSSFGGLTSHQSGASSFGSLTPNQPELSSCGSLTPNQAGLSSFGILATNQSGVSSFGSFTPNQPGLGSFESLTSNQPGSSNFFSFDIQSFLNDEDETYNLPQPNLGTPQLENLNIFDDLGSINELPCDTSNFQFDHNKQQGEDDSSKFDLPELPAQLNQTCPIEEDIGGDWTFVNTNQGHFNGETSNTFVAPETNFPDFNMSPIHNQEQDTADFIDWSFLERQDLVGDDFMDSLFTNDMN